MSLQDILWDRLQQGVPAISVSPSDMSPAAEDTATAAGRFKIFFTADAGLAIPFFLPFDCLAGFLQGLASRFFPAAPFPLLVNSSRKAAIAACGPQVSLSASYRFSASAMGCVAAATGFESSKATQALLRSPLRPEAPTSESLVCQPRSVEIVSAHAPLRWLQHAQSSRINLTTCRQH